MAIKSAIMNVMTAVAEKAARSLVHDFGEVEQLQVSKKGPADFVSTADLNAENIIRAELSKARPDYGFLMEESGESTGRLESRRWIVDPLDGTTNFLHGIPHWAISIALEADGEIVAGVIYDPIKNEMFTTEKGQGAFVNARRMRVSGRDNLAESVIATCIPISSRTPPDTYLPVLRSCMDASVSIRRLGSAALDLAYVASGRYEAFFEYSLKPWDVAAGVLMVAESGGYATTISGHGNVVYDGPVLAANTQLHPVIAKMLRPELSSPLLAETSAVIAAN